MANSINTNTGAMVALQSLNQTSRDLITTQNRVSTGLKVASAKDNGAVWAVAQTQKANMIALDATKTNLQRSQSVNDVGLAAGESVMDALVQMKSLAASIAAGVGDTAAYEADYDALVTEITASIAAASFDGTTALTLTLTLGAGSAATEATVQTAIDAPASAASTWSA